MSETVKKPRNSSLELLKMICMFVIVYAHSMPIMGQLHLGVNHESFYDINLSDGSIQRFLMLTIRNLGHVGNDIFIICSCYFLPNSMTVKPKKIACLALDASVFSWVYLAIFLAAGTEISKSNIIKSIFPHTALFYWFVTCYVLLYAIHPLLNTLINNISQKQHLLYCVVFFVLYFGINFIKITFFYTKLIGFIGIYFICAYTNKYMKNFFASRKNNLILIGICAVCWFLLTLATDILGQHISFVSNMMAHWTVLMNPFAETIALCVFNLFKSVHFENKKINYFASITLTIYLAHTNVYVMNYLKFNIYDRIHRNFGYDHLLLWVLIFGTCMLIAATLIAMLYHKFIQPFVYKLAGKLTDLLIKLYGKVEAALLNVD